MRIAKNQIDFMTKCTKRPYISSEMTGEEIEIAEYLIWRKFAKSTGNDVKTYLLTQEGKAYLYEYKDMKRQRTWTTAVAFLALIVSIISLTLQF